MPSSLIEAVSDQIGTGRFVPAEQDVRALAAVLASVPDRRSPRGRRYPLAFLLVAAMAAVLAGCRSLAGIAQWTATADDATLARLGAAGRWTRPAATTFGRALAALDGDDLDRIAGRWLAGLARQAGGDRLPTAAADGKTVRGAADRAGNAPHLVAVYQPDTGCVLGQIQTTAKAKGNEIAALRKLLTRLDITGLTITADAMHCQRDTATAIVAAGGHYLLFVKVNQPSLLRQIQRPFTGGKGVTRGQTTVEAGHGRREERTARTAAPRYLDFPHATQAVKISRTRTVNGRTSRQTAWAVTDLTPDQAGPDQLARAARDHWSVEALHHIRDVTYAEDASRIRTRSTPRVMASLRNLAISLLKLLGWDNIAEANRHMAAHRHDTLTLIGLTP